MTLLMAAGTGLRAVLGRLVGHPLDTRRRRVLRDLERRRRWAEQARKTPTVRQLKEAASASAWDSGAGRRRPAG